MRAGTLRVPGAGLYYELRGSGPVPLMRTPPACRRAPRG